jgi:cytosine/adenosine deaminase-related metal-dependent hydrolase
VLGEPVVSLAAQAHIPDGGLVVQDAVIVAAGRRAEMEAIGSFDRVLGSRRHFVLPGFVNCTDHSELARHPSWPISPL